MQVHVGTHLMEAHPSSDPAVTLYVLENPKKIMPSLGENVRGPMLPGASSGSLVKLASVETPICRYQVQVRWVPTHGDLSCSCVTCIHFTHNSEKRGASQMMWKHRDPYRRFSWKGSKATCIAGAASDISSCDSDNFAAVQYATTESSDNRPKPSNLLPIRQGQDEDKLWFEENTMDLGTWHLETT